MALDIRSEFARILYERRKQLKRRQVDISREIGVTQSYLSGLESGIFDKPSFEVAVKLSIALNLDPGILMKEVIKLRVPVEYRRYILKNRCPKCGHIF